jgi:chromosome segregation ATPase
MNIKSYSVALLGVILFGMVTVLGGCATTGMERSTATVNSIDDVDAEIRIMTTNIDVTAASLDNLGKSEPAGLKRSFDSYSDNLAKLDAQGKLVIKRVGEMKANSKEYFAEWEKQGDTYTNPKIRQLSEERRIKLAEIYAQVPIAGAGIEESYQSYLTNLKEIHRYLSNDLTSSGVNAIAPVTQTAFRDLDRLKESLKPLIRALDDIKAELYSAKN